MDIIKLIVAAVEIPDGAKVCKLRGTTLYTLRHEITIYPDAGYGSHGQKQVIKSPDVRYLIGDNGSINAVSVAAELVWLATADDVRDHLDPDHLDPIEDK